MPWLAEDPAKRAVERWWLLYTPVWGAALGVLMLTGWAATWGDPACLALGVLVALGAVVPPLLRPVGEDRSRPLHQRTSTKMILSVVLLAFGLNYAMTRLFCYDDLGLALGFGTIAYGFSFVVALPMWMAIDERPGQVLPTRLVFVYGAAALFADWLWLELVRHLVAPMVTTVVPDAPGLRDYGPGSCLEP